jgi:hypothetical protein
MRSSLGELRAGGWAVHEAANVSFDPLKSLDEPQREPCCGMRLRIVGIVGICINLV